MHSKLSCYLKKVATIVSVTLVVAAVFVASSIGDKFREQKLEVKHHMDAKILIKKHPEWLLSDEEALHYVKTRGLD
jgi:hypothetical protein